MTAAMAHRAQAKRDQDRWFREAQEARDALEAHRLRTGYYDKLDHYPLPPEQTGLTQKMEEQP